jgi:hypothetical protein
MKTAIAWILVFSVASAQAYTGRRFERSGGRGGGSWGRHFPRQAGQTFQIRRDRYLASQSAPRTAPSAAATTMPDTRRAGDVGNTVWSTSAGGGPQSVCRYVRARVTYQKDQVPEDQWRSGEETLALGRGDCEDFAAAVRDRCRERGIPSAIYVMRAPDLDGAHAVTIGSWGGRMWMSSNGDYREIRSLEYACELVASDCGWQGATVTISKAEGR